MRLLVIIPSLHRGGAERVVSILTQEWCKTHEVLIAVFDASQPAYYHDGKLFDLFVSAQDGVMRKMANAIKRILRLSGVMRRERPDCIISFMESANFPTIFASLMTGHLGKLSVSVRNDPARFPYAYRWLIPLIYRLPRRVVAVSQGVAQALAGMGVPKNRLIAIPNPAPQPLVGKFIDRTEPPHTRYILGVGRLHRQKGFDRLLHAFAGIDDPELHLVILGEGGERDALEELAASLGIAARVSLPGAMADPMPWYQNATCFVLSSRHEGWPNVLLEAMSNSCPVLSFDCQYGPAEIIEHGVSFLLVEEGNVEALGNAISNLFCEESIRVALIKGGLLRVKEFKVERLAEQWLESALWRGSL